MKKSTQIKWSPLSDKHIKYIKNAIHQRLAVGEGAIRSGKTIDNCLVAYIYLETCEDKIHLASGSTIANAKMNIGDCNGFGLEHLFRGRCKWGKYKDNEALKIQSRNGEKIVVFAGGGKADSFKKILGNAYGLWIATEINQHYDSDENDSFIGVAFGRQVAAKKPLTLWDLNPSSPNHTIYSKYIDKYKNEGLVGGYYYEHFTIADNLSISDERRLEIESLYDKTSIWYRRDILGERCIAEGIIYQELANHPKNYILSKTQFEKVRPHIIEISVGIDFGGNGSKHTFVAVGFTRFYKDVIVLQSERLDGEFSPEQLNNRFVKFAQEIYNKYGRAFNSNFDNAEPVLARGLANESMRSGCRTNLVPAWKMEIMQRIRLTTTLISQSRLWFLENDSQTCIDALCTCVWDNKHPDTRLDNGTSDIDTCDAFEYSIEKHSADLLAVKNSLIKEIL